MNLKSIISLIPVCITSSIITLSSSCNNKIDKPLRAIGTAQGMNSQTASNIFSKAQNLQSAGKMKSALKTYALVANKFPLSAEAPKARYEQASILHTKGKLLESFKTYQQFIEKYKSSSLYSTAIQKQSEVALAAANGNIKHNFAGLKSKLAGKKIQEMLTKVINNAPFSKHAPKAQFAIGKVWQDRGEKNKAIAGYKGVQERYPNSSLTPEALYRTGAILMAHNTKGNRNRSSLDNAKNILLDLRQQYPKHPRAKDAKKRLAKLEESDIQRSLDIAEFYLQKGQKASATYYYREVMRKSPSGPLYNRAKSRLAEIGQ